MIAGRWFITPHAVTRYRQRIAPHLTYEHALAELIRASQTAHRCTPRHDVPGAWLWRGGRPLRLRFIVQERVPPGSLPQLLTVYGGHDTWTPANSPRPATLLDPCE